MQRAVGVLGVAQRVDLPLPASLGATNFARQHLPRLLVRTARDDDGARCHCVEIVEELQVPVAVEGAEQLAPGVGVALRHRRVDALCDRSLDQRRRLGGHQLAQPLVDHLGVAGRAQLTAQPLELVTQRLRHGTIEQPAKRGERTAKPSRGDPHLVHGVLVIPPHVRVEGDETLHLVGEMGGDHFPRGGAVVQLDRGRRGRRGVPERTTQLGSPWRRLGAGVLESMGRRGENVAVAVDELDLDFPPDRDGGVGGEKRGTGDVIVGHLGQHVVVPADHPVENAPALELGDRHELAAAGPRADEAGELLRHAVARRAEWQRGSRVARCRSPTP